MQTDCDFSLTGHVASRTTSLGGIHFRWCGLCNCWSGKQHVEGGPRQKRALQHAWDSLFCGTPEQARAPASGCALPPGQQTLDFEHLVQRWGPSLLHMASQAMVAVRARSGSILIKAGDATGKVVGHKDIRGNSLVYINYRNGQGRYTATSVAVWNHQLPWNVPEGLRQAEWWPVVIWDLEESWLANHKHDDLENTPDDFMDQDGDNDLMNGGAPRLAFASCIKQLAGALPVAWPIRLHPRPRPRPPLPPHGPAPRQEAVPWEEEVPPPRVPVLRLRGNGPPPPPPPTWGDAQQPGAIAAAAEEVD